MLCVFIVYLYGVIIFWLLNKGKLVDFICKKIKGESEIEDFVIGLLEIMLKIIGVDVGFRCKDCLLEG